MVFDPGWDMPQINWQQQGSFEPGEIPPAVSPDAGTQICIGPIAREWLPVMLGALDQLRNPSTWIVPDDATMYQTLARVDLLREIVALSEGCEVPVQTRLQNCVLQTSSNGGVTWVDVPGWAAGFADCVKSSLPSLPPVIPPGSAVNQRACNVAGYLANEIIKKSMALAVSDYNAGLDALSYASNVSQTILSQALPYTNLFVQATYDFYRLFTAGTIAGFTAASTDVALWSAVTCAIYTGIKDVGYLVPSNFAAVLNNVCTIAYVPANIIPAICNYMTTMAVSNLESMQAFGALDIVNCDACGISCWQWNFVDGVGPWTIGGGACGYGVFDAGTHFFVSTGPAAGCLPASSVLNIQVVFAAAQHIKGVLWRAGAGDTSPLASRRCQGYLGGALVFNLNPDQGAFAYPHIVSVSPDAIVDKIIIFNDCLFPSTYSIDSVAIDFAGVNPFGPSNCTYEGGIVT